MSNYTCEECMGTLHELEGDNEEYESLSDLVPGYDQVDKAFNHIQEYTVAGKNCLVPERYTKIAETENMVLYKENN